MYQVPCPITETARSAPPNFNSRTRTSLCLLSRATPATPVVKRVSVSHDHHYHEADFAERDAPQQANNNTHRLTAQSTSTSRLYILLNFSLEKPVFLVGIERNFHMRVAMLAKAAAVCVKQKCLPGNF
jgi:hypothetical protein